MQLTVPLREAVVLSLNDDDGELRSNVGVRSSVVSSLCIGNSELLNCIVLSALSLLRYCTQDRSIAPLCITFHVSSAYSR